MFFFYRQTEFEDSGPVISEAEKGRVIVAPFKHDWKTCVASLCDFSGIATKLDGRPVLIKPNLVEALQPPITTPVSLVEAIVSYLQEKAAGIRIIIGEGTAAKDYSTWYCFAQLGYEKLARQYDVELIDLNEEELIEKRNPHCRRFPEMHLPAIVYDSFLLSVPVLKAHSLAGVTLTMKNVMGAAPPSHYQCGGHWKKSAFHQDMQQAVLDLNRYRSPDFSILDATVGMQVAHLWGPVCDPQPGLVAASFDPVAIDAWGASILGRDWRGIGHIRDAHHELGLAEPLRLENINHA